MVLRLADKQSELVQDIQPTIMQLEQIAKSDCQRDARIAQAASEIEHTVVSFRILGPLLEGCTGAAGAAACVAIVCRKFRKTSVDRRLGTRIFCNIRCL